MSLQSALLNASSGLLLTQRALANTANDIANAGTVGHTKKTVNGRAVTAAGTGIGVKTLLPTRDVDLALISELNSRRSAYAGASARESLLKTIEGVYGSPEVGNSFGDLTAALHTAFEDLRANPSEPGRMASVALDAESLAIRLNEVSGAIGKARQDVQYGISTEVDEINASLRQIANLTKQIQNEIVNTGGPAAALEDQRDSVIAKLAESLEVKALRREDGGIVIVARNGIVLPLDEEGDALQTSGAALNPGSFHGPGGTIPGITLNGLDVTNSLAGGRLAEYVMLRDETLPRYQAEVDLAATNIAYRFEQQGLRLFTDVGGTVPDPSSPYAGSGIIGFAGRIKINDLIKADPSILRDGTHAVAGSPTGASAFDPNPSGGPAGFTGLLDRVVNFTFGSNAQSGVAWGPISTAGLGPEGNLSSPFSAPATLEAYTALLTGLHTADRTAASERAAIALRTMDGLETRFAQRSGVDVDSEMATMVTLQNAYAANARVMSTVQVMWDTLLNSVR